MLKCLCFKSSKRSNSPVMQNFRSPTLPYQKEMRAVARKDWRSMLERARLLCLIPFILNINKPANARVVAVP
jgi:hypothetical protein